MKASYKRKLSIDIETYSSEDIKNGVYRYASSSDFELLLFAYAYGDEPVQLVDVKSGEEIPFEVIEDLYDETVEKHAFNAQFERVCLSRYLDPVAYPSGLLSPRNWHCSSVLSAMLGMPSSLEKAGEALNLSEDKQKLKTGKALIKYFCLPCAPTRTNGMRTRNLPMHDPDKWHLFKEYCIRDVVTERAIFEQLSPYNLNTEEQPLYELDQSINDRGILLDKEAIDNILVYDEIRQDELTKNLYKLTGLNNPNSVGQLKGWVEDQLGEELEGLTKNIVKDLLVQDLPGDIEEALKARQELGKTSISKYTKMNGCILKTNSIHGVLQFYGANRTGRWAGRLVQVQNLPQNKIKELDDVRQLVKENRFEALEMLYENVSDLLSQLIRTMFIPREGMQFAVCDFSAIEARVIAWLAGEKWRQEVFATHGKIYEASASKMFNVPIEEIGKGSPLRQKGKVAELACGYQGGVGALKAMGADAMGLTDAELSQLIEDWRNSNSHIVGLWKELELAVKKAIRTNETQFAAKNKLKIFTKKHWLFIRLPSGRHLAYAYPKLVQSSYGDKIVFYGMSQTTNKWCEQDTYGGKLVENVVQAIARDCLADSMLAMHKLNEKVGGLDIVMHIHDEIVVETTQPEVTLSMMEAIMRSEIHWAEGLQLKGDGFITAYYKKD